MPETKAKIDQRMVANNITIQKLQRHRSEQDEMIRKTSERLESLKKQLKDIDAELDHYHGYGNWLAEQRDQAE